MWVSWWSRVLTSAVAMSSLRLGMSLGRWPGVVIWIVSCSITICRLGVAVSWPQKESRTPLVPMLNWESRPLRDVALQGTSEPRVYAGKPIPTSGLNSAHYGPTRSGC
jgi:hypothetical protein